MNIFGIDWVGVNAENERKLLDAMSRQIIAGLDAAGIGIVSATYDIVDSPPLDLRRVRPTVATSPAV